MFSSQMLEATTNRVEVKDTDPDVFSHMLKFIYCAQLPENLTSIASSLLPLADKYGVDELKAACVASVRESLTKDNAVDILLLAEAHGCPQLKEASIRKLNRWKDGMAANVFDPLREHPGLLFELFTFKRSYDLDRDTDYESDQEYLEAF